MRFLKKTPKKTISFLTDIEGNLRYLKQWADRSNYLRYESGRLLFRQSTGDSYFIHGGDFCDKGPADLRIGSMLVHFKKLYPKRVFLIAGNREIKCRRFTYELTHNVRERLMHGPAPFWNQNALPRRYVTKQMAKEKTSNLDLESYLTKKTDEQCQTLYLQWMLNETMGCGSTHGKPSTFEYRRREIATLSNRPLEKVSDEEVTQSFIASVKPGGIVTEYLKEAQLGKIIGETLFIHGAVTLENMGWLPNQENRINNAREWIDALNDWYSQQIKEWLKNPVEEAKLHAPGHKLLDQYVIHNPKSIVTTNWYSQGGLAPINKKIVEFLNKSGIYRVVSGHQPFGDFPLIIREKNLEIIAADTSYSDTTAIEDNRGKALHNLDIIQFDGAGFAKIDAIFKDGSNVNVSLPSRSQVAMGDDTLIGHFTSQGQLIRQFNESGLGASYLEGHEIVTRPLEKCELSFLRN